MVNQPGSNIKSLKAKLLFAPIVFFVLLLVAFIFTLKVGFQKINTVRAELTLAKKNELLLFEKLSILREADGIIGSYSGISTIALPNENPSLLSISQAKIVASENLSVLTNFRIEGQVVGKNDYFSSEMLFDVEGSLFEVLSIVEQMIETLPVLTIEKVNIVNAANLSAAKITLRNYWADFPTTIPKISEPVVGLNTADIEILSKILEYKLPTFSSLEPEPASGRTDPFN